MISLNYRDSRPIYEQIKDGLRKLIVTGALRTGEKLPSVRALATQLSINPNTIQRAYNELEGEGYIYSVPGKGSFAAGNTGADEARRKELTEKLRELAAELKYLGVTGEELAALVSEAPEISGQNREKEETP
ncbi:GntR family transcriptional regulator [Oscillibacter valericigenes]|uniref:GntR family transcriptional regulator n=1 Tax=Oscillibacter valericigenes TaxID=351091 RepID=UPI001F220C4C|nr:GntR family transcriptional regulator [Oscillibacter valericigenes]MCF2616252.1 GntR family transcriptional regulator [Oscillibacter valericigenes]